MNSELLTNRTAVLFDPYLDTLGGGERYTLTIADYLSALDWSVLLAWDNPHIIDLARQRFALALKNVQTDSEYFHLFQSKTDLQTRFRSLKDLGLVFVVSDGSVPILFGKKTILHYQVPFTSSNRLPFLNQLKLLTVDRLVVNSLFTKKIIDRTLRTNKSIVLYPPVDVDSFRSHIKKQKVILSVGRFTSLLNSKRQDILILAFKQLCDQGLKGWRLVLAGGVLGNDPVLDSLRQQAEKYPIDFVVNPNFQKLQQLYSQATLYWHAAGFEVDEKINPEATEHFGITTVEAMAAGCVPLVVNKGGQTEVVSDDTGYLWDTTEQLITFTKYLLDNPQKLKALSQAASKRAEDFSRDRFVGSFQNLLK